MIERKKEVVFENCRKKREWESRGEGEKERMKRR
jgi:hypothetical protein